MRTLLHRRFHWLTVLRNHLLILSRTLFFNYNTIKAAIGSRRRLAAPVFVRFVIHDGHCGTIFLVCAFARVHMLVTAEGQTAWYWRGHVLGDTLDSDDGLCVALGIFLEISLARVGLWLIDEHSSVLLDGYRVMLIFIMFFEVGHGYSWHVLGISLFWLFLVVLISVFSLPESLHLVFDYQYFENIFKMILMLG